MNISTFMPHASTGQQGRAVAFTLLIGSIIPLGVQAAPEPPGILTLYQTIENNTELSCSFDVPEAGSGRNAVFYPRGTKETNGQCEGNEQDENDKLFQPHSIRIKNAPAAARFFLSDRINYPQLNCSKEGNWLELETTRPLSSLEKMGLDKITDYGGYITNQGIDSQARSIGFKIVDHNGNIPQGKLSCIEVNTSAGVSSGSK